MSDWEGGSRFSVFHVSGNDTPFHAMTQYVMALSQSLNGMGIDSRVVTDASPRVFPRGYHDVLVPVVRWQDLDANLLGDLVRERPFVLHLHLAPPHHGTVVDPELLATVPSVVTCHEFASSSMSERDEQLRYCRHASKILVSSRRDASALGCYPDLRHRLFSATKSGDKMQLVFPVPSNIPLVPAVRTEAPSLGVTWFGMFRRGYDWPLLMEIAQRFTRRHPDVPFSLMGATANARILVSIAEHVLGSDLGDLRRIASQREQQTDELVAERIAALSARWQGEGGIQLRLNQPAEAVSRFLALNTTCAVQVRPPQSAHHSGSLAALLEHGLPVVSAYTMRAGEIKPRRQSVSRGPRARVTYVHGRSLDETATLAVNAVERLLEVGGAPGGAGDGCARSAAAARRQLAAGCILAYQDTLEHWDRIGNGRLETEPFHLQPGLERNR